MKVAIVDYGMGNIRSLTTTLTYLGVSDVILSNNYEILKSADKIILPGVGSFGKAMQQIRERKIDVYLKDLVVNSGKPMLGVCLGMQLVGNSSTEDGYNEGLGLVDAEVTRLSAPNIKVPHVGFNQIAISQNSRLFDGMAANPDFYFTHSYKMLTQSNINVSACEYGERFVAAFEYKNIAGVQFHPELSQKNGLHLLKNFLEKF
ncbi:imidazole glycerol phosphate synthase subunit HisH [Mucilaginibacter calamicampi]|uniref:Imidazole glycerol phosphate synthase subunit HisH n=1 Tax=Mucilaginibacter calamicampi TaxID=1302352 RepID=A0ABW2YT87_9SPHI